MAEGMKPQIDNDVIEVLQKTIRNNTPTLKEFASIITTDDNEKIRSELVNAKTKDQFDNAIEKVAKLVSGGEDAQKEFFTNLQNDLTEIFHKSAFLGEKNGDKTAEIVKGIVNGLNTSGNAKDDAPMVLDIEQAIKKLSNGETPNTINVESGTNDVDVSLDYLKSVDETFMNDISKIYNVEGGEVKETGTVGDFIKASDGLAKKLEEQQKKLKIEIEKQTKHVERLASNSDTSTDDINEQQDLLDSMNDSLEALVKITEKSVERSNKTIGVSEGTKKGLNTLNNENKKSAEKSADDKMDEGKSSFDILKQGAKGFGDSLDGVERAADGLSNAFEKVGNGMNSFGEMKGMFSQFTNVLSQGVFTVAAFGSAMALAGTMIGKYHDQLDISRSMGDQGGSLVKDLQNMHINSLIPPDQLKALSETVSGSFNVSLTNNKKEMERIATKQRLSERMMGKEYSEAQMEALGTLSTALESQSVSGMMDELSNQTSALAKTMGVSNKYALEQIKAIHENTKELTKNMDTGMKKTVEEEFQKIAAGLKKMGLKEEEITALREASVKQLATADGGLEFAQQTMMMQSDPAMLKMLEEVAAATGAGSSDDIIKAVQAIQLSQGNADEAAILLKNQGMFETVEEASAYLVKATTASNLAVNKALDVAEKSGDVAKIKIIKSRAGEGVLDRRIGTTLSKDGALDKYKSGESEASSRIIGEQITDELDQLLVTMGASNIEEKLAKLTEVRTGFIGDDETKKTKLAEAVKAQGNTERVKELEDKKAKNGGVLNKEDQAELNTILNDAFKTAFAGDIKKEIDGAVEKGGDGKILGTNVTGTELKSVATSKDYDEKRNKANGTGVENTKDELERASTKALYEFQNAIMDAVGWLMNNWKIAMVAFGGMMLLFAVKGPLGKGISLLGKGILGAANVIGGAAFEITKGIAKGLISAPGLILKGLKSGMSLVGKAFSIGAKGMKLAWQAGGKMIEAGSKLANAGLSLLKAPKNLWDGIKNGFKGFSLDTVKDKISGFASSFGEKIGSMKDSLVGGFKNISAQFKTGKSIAKGESSSIGGPDTKLTFFESFGKKWEGFKSTIKGGLKSIGGGLKTMVGPAALLGAGMQALQGGMEGWGKATQWFKGDLEKLGPLTEEQAKAISKSGKVVEKNGQFYDAVSDDLIERQASFSQKAAGALGGAIGALSFGLLDGQTMAYKVADAFTWIGTKMDEIGLTETFSELGTALSAIGSKIAEVVGKIFKFLSPVFDAAKSVFSGIFKYIRGFFQLLTGIFTGDLSKIGEGVKTIMSGFVDIILSPLKLVTGFIDKLFGTDITSSITGFGTWLSNFFGGLVDFIFSPIETIKNLFKSFGVDITKPFEAVSNYFSTIFDSAIKGAFAIWDGFTSLVTKPFDYIIGFINGEFTFKEAVMGIFNSVINGVTSIFSGFVDIVTAPFKGILSFVDTMFETNLLGGFSSILDGLVSSVSTYFSSIGSGVMNIVGGYWDIITSPFKRISAWFSGEANFFETITGIWSDVKNGIVSIFSGFIDIITAPFKGIITFIDETFGTDLLGSFTAVKDGILSVFEGFIDLVTAPFKGIVAWLSGEEFSVTGAVSDAFTKALDGIGSVLSGLKEMLISPFKSVVKYLEEKLAKLDPTKWFSDTPEEKEQKEKAKAGDQIHKDLVKQGLITDDYGNDSVSAEQAAKMTAEQIGAILAAHNKSYTGTLESGAIEELKKALQAKADAGDKQAALEIQTLPAKKEGGSTGGPIGDQIAGAFDELRVFAAEPTEIPTATAGENEYVVNAEEGGLLAKAFTKVKGFASKLFGGEKGEVKKGSVGKLPTLSNISTSTSTSTGDASAKIQEKIQTQGIHSLTVDELSEAINLNEELKNEFIDTTPTLESGFSELKKQLAPITKFYKKPIFIDESSITESDSADVLTDGLDTIAKKVGSMSSAMWSWGKNVAKTVVSTVKEKGVIGAAKHGAGKVYETVKSGIGKAADFVKDIAKHLHKSETGKASGDYSAAADIGDGAGISFGAYQLTEKSGGIKDFMKVMAENGDKQALAMMEKFKGNNFTGSDKELTDYLKKVGSTEEGKKAQDDIYSKKYLEPALKLAESKGITDPAAIAQIVDHSVNAGLGGAKRMLGKAEGVSVEDLANARKQDYKDIATKNPKLEKYVKGWTNRVDNNSTTFAKWEGVDLKGRESISASEKAQESKVKDLSKKERKEQTIAQKKISNEQVKKQTKEGIDDKQATQMVTSLKDVVVNLKEQGKSVLFKAKDGLGSVVTKSLGAAGIVGSSISQNVSGVLSGDVSASDALKNVGQTIVGQLPGKITESLKSVIDKLGATGASITTNLQGVLTGETSIGDALKNVGGTMQEQLLGPLQTNLSSAFNSFTGEGGPLDSVFDAFDGDGSISDTFKTITSPEGPLGSALGGIGESITGALGSFDFGGMLGGIGDAVGGLFGGGSSSGGSGGGVMDSVMSAGKSLLGGFFASGGVTKPETINVIGESGPELVGSMEAMAVMNKQQWEQFGQAAGFTQGGGLEFKGPGDKASAGNIPSSAGTSGISTMGSGVKSSSVINNSTKTQTVASTTNTTNNNISGETAGASKDPIAQKLDVLINSVNKLVSHSGQQVKQGDRKFKADVNGQTVQNVKNMQGSKTLS